MSTNSDNKNTDINLNIDGADNQVDYEDDEVDFPLQDSAVLGADEPQTNSEDAMKELNEKLANAEKNVSQYANTIKKNEGGVGGKSEQHIPPSQVDGKSVFISQVDYSVTPDELQQFFQNCGAVDRITILTNAQKQPKGSAYIEFNDEKGAQNAILLTGSELKGRKITVMPKRINVPRFQRGGFRGGRGGYRGRGGFRGGRGGYRGRGRY